MDDEAVHEELHAARFGWALAGLCPLYARWWPRIRQADVLLVRSTEHAVAVRTRPGAAVAPLTVRPARWSCHDSLLITAENLLHLPDPTDAHRPLRLRLAGLTASERGGLEVS